MEKRKIEKILLGNLSNIFGLFLISVVLFLVNFIFRAEAETFLLILSLVIVFHVSKADSRLLILAAIILLIYSAIVLAFFEDESYANIIAIQAYWFLVSGVICQVIEFFQERKE